MYHIGVINTSQEYTNSDPSFARVIDNLWTLEPLTVNQSPEWKILLGNTSNSFHSYSKELSNKKPLTLLVPFTQLKHRNNQKCQRIIEPNRINF
jgi:hypothetical protein